MLGVFSKYPRISNVPALEGSQKASEKKLGVLAADLESFEAIAKVTGLKSKMPGAWCRHPLAFLMEAADDICYHIIDLEDGHRVGRVPFKQTEELLEPIAFANPHNAKGPSYTNIDDEKGKVEYLRALSINEMIDAVVEVFIDHYHAIMVGEFEEGLVSKCKHVSQMNRINDVSLRSIYTAPNVIHIEAAGFEVLGGLLDKIAPALVKDRDDRSDGESKLLQLLPNEYKRGHTRYERLLAATDYVSGMTDSFALRLFRRLRGIELPRG
jgi:dGTPase